MRSPGYREGKRARPAVRQAGFEARAGAKFPGPGREAPQHRAPHGLLQRGKMGAALQFERHLAGLEADKAIVSYK